MIVNHLYHHHALVPHHLLQYLLQRVHLWNLMKLQKSYYLNFARVLYEKQMKIHDIWINSETKQKNNYLMNSNNSKAKELLKYVMLN